MTTFRPITDADSAREPSPIGNSDTPFPLHALPPGIRAYIEAVTRQNGIPVELAAATALSVLSAATGSGIRLNSGSGRRLTPNVYFLVGARSGLGKSVTYNQMAAPLIDEQARVIEAWKRAKDEAEGEPPPFPAFVVSNATSEAVARALSVNPGNAAAVMSPDARGAIGILEGRYAKNGGMDLDLYLSAFSGDAMTYLRRGSECFTIKAPCLTVFFAVQPDKLTDLCANPEFLESGLAARFLMVRCGGASGDEGAEVENGIVGQWEGIVREALELRAAADADAVIDLDGDAMEIRKALAADQKRMLRESKTPALDSLMSRVAEQAQRIALLMHVARNGRRAPEFPVSADEMRGGEAVARWFLPKAAELLAPATTAAAEKDRQKVLRVFAEKGVKQITARILRSNHGIFEETVERLAAAYPRQFRLHRKKGETGGRPSPVLEMIG
jgi:hypothetical protein